MSHKVGVRQSERGTDFGGTGSNGNVTLVTLHHVTITRGRERVTLLSESRRRVLGIPQKVIEPTPRSQHPLNPDMGRAPLLLEVGPQKVGDGHHEVQRTTIPEVESRPSVHWGIVA